jgi:hypothetical protein
MSEHVAPLSEMVIIRSKYSAMVRVVAPSHRSDGFVGV